ncbi:DUF4123 domain-containing protein [Erwinia sorbitola]|uniref:DUF4123 domain-containing protein n=1 Tax=Erwinia sorbitola TaxID=2681984 RepID=A0ABW9RGE2_9GAMM|nr:DUF4123 domain-containing protein [Erwinia sorbitola]MTD29076.1 DUF4123 domain-containing protein [Erwinia sorbitola]
MTIRYRTLHLPLGEHQYAIIDRQRISELPDSWPVTELILPALAPQAHLYPWLVALHDLSSEQWKALMAELTRPDKTRSPEICTLLLSGSGSRQEVSHALIKALYFRDEQQNGHILRFYDPRVLFHLHWMLSPWQLFNQLSARVLPYWTFWLDGGWHTLEFPESIAFTSTENGTIKPSQLQYCGRINQALEKLPYSTDLTERQQISRRLEALLAQAVECKLPTWEDRIAFALHGLVQREGFWHAPKMSAFLQQASQNPDFYRDKTSGWDERRWEEMTGVHPRYTGSYL